MIEIKGLTKRFDGFTALQELNMTVPQASVYGLVGPNGPGKSTIIRHVTGIYSPDSGTVLVDGMNVGELDSRGLEKFRTRIGMLFQGGALLNWLNIYDNVALPLRERTSLSEEQIRERVNPMLELLELRGAAAKMPSEISGGMIKRAGLARAVVCEPKIMLYDEPTSGLDPVMSRRIDSLIDSMKHKYRMTSVVVTHDLVSALNIGDRIAMIAEGRIIECDTPEMFMNSRHPLVREFIRAQFHTGRKKVSP